MILYKDVTGKGRVAMTAKEATSFEASRAPKPKPTNPASYTHSRRQFRVILTDAQEAEIKAAIQAMPKGKAKRATRAWWADETEYRWDDVEFRKLRKLLLPDTVTAIKESWII